MGCLFIKLDGCMKMTLHPSYPAAHGCLSTAAMQVLGYLFPNEAKFIMGKADEAGHSLPKRSLSPYPLSPRLAARAYFVMAIQS